MGLVYIGLAGPGNEVISFEHRFGTIRGRSLIRYVSANAALDNLRRQLQKRLVPQGGSQKSKVKSQN